MPSVRWAYDKTRYRSELFSGHVKSRNTCTSPVASMKRRDGIHSPYSKAGWLHLVTDSFSAPSQTATVITTQLLTSSKTASVMTGIAGIIGGLPEGPRYGPNRSRNPDTHPWSQ